MARPWRGGSELLGEPLGSGEMREVPATGPDIDHGCGQLHAEPLPVAGCRLVAGDVNVGHTRRPQGRRRVSSPGR